MSAERAPRGLIERVVAAWGDLGGATRAFLAERPSEARLVGLLALVALVRFAGATMAQAASGLVLDDRIRLAQERFIGDFLVTPLGVYALAAIGAPLLRTAGGSGDATGTRRALVWSLVVAAPLLFALAALEGLGVRPGLGGPAAIGALALGLGALYVTAAALAAAHGLRSSARLFAALAAAIGAIGGAAAVIGAAR